MFSDPIVVTELLQRLYREQGYLNVEIDKPRYEFEGAVARVILDIREGAQFTVQRRDDERQLGDHDADPDHGAAGGARRSVHADRRRERVAVHPRPYWARGYNDVRVAYQLTVDRIGGRASVDFTINEGRQAVVSEIRIAGNDKTSERLVREQIIVTPARAAEPAGAQPLAQEPLRQRRVLDRRFVARHRSVDTAERMRWWAR